jgi:transcriptional regulator with XRE-family HTH domain
MEGLATASTEEAPALSGETMKQYVIRRAGEVKRYQAVASATGVNRHWLAKLAIGKIPRPNYDDIQKLHDYYRGLELGTA